MGNFEIIFFDTDGGERPAREFIMSQDDDMRVKIYRNIKVLETLGHKLREPLSAPLGDGIFEIRTQFDGNITRVLYFFVHGRRIVLTNGFVKKRQKTPQSEIDKAITYRKIFLEREKLQ